MTQTNEANNLQFNKALFLLGLANLFFAFQFILRISLGVLREEIIEKFAINAEQFGTLAGSYYLGYALLQLPLGVMLDRLNFRLISSISIALVSVGTLIFQTAESFQLLLISRFIIGAGSGVSFLAIAKIIKIFFQEKYHSYLIGFSFTFGLFGAYIGGGPMYLAYKYYGFENTFQLLAITILLIAGLMLKFGNLEQTKNSASLKSISLDIIKLIIQPKILLISVCGGLLVGTLEGFGDLWSFPFYHQFMGFDKTTSLDISMKLFFGMCVGGPVLAFFGKLLRSDDVMIAISGLLIVKIFLILFYIKIESVFICSLLMFYLGILCSYQVLVFSSVSSRVSSNKASLSIAVVNCINMVFGHIFHTIIGKSFVLGESINNGNIIYSNFDFIYSLSIIPIASALGALGFTALILYEYCSSKRF